MPTEFLFALRSHKPIVIQVVFIRVRLELEVLQILLLELRHLPTGHHFTIRRRSILFIVIFFLRSLPFLLFGAF